MGMGDIMAQCIEDSIRASESSSVAFDWRRTAKMALFGAVVSAPGTMSIAVF
jgi:hypothetical protein